MSSFENFVQCRVVTPFTAAASEIGLFAADTPHRLPAEGGGVLVLTDSPYRPSALEVIRYGRRTGLALYEVSRAQEGTTARDWTGVAFCYQALTAGELERLLSEKAEASALDGLRQEAQAALDSKVDKVAGKSLSTNDYTTAEKNKLANANLMALVGLSGAADRVPYFTGAGALSLATLTVAARTLLAAASVAGQQSALGLFADASGVMTSASGVLTNWVSQFLQSADAVTGRSQLGLGTAAVRNVASSEWLPAGGDVLASSTLGIGVVRGPIRNLVSLEDIQNTGAGARFMVNPNLSAPSVLEALGGWPPGSWPYMNVMWKRDGSHGGWGAFMCRYDNPGTLRFVILDSSVSQTKYVDLIHTGNASALPITGALSPLTDNLRPLGEAAKRWSTAHLGTAPIVTSDRDAKMDILPIDDAVLDAWETLDYMQYRLKDAVAAKGEAARTHAGLIAQDIREAFEAAGLDPFKYGVLCYDEWEQELLEHPAEYEWITVPAVLDDEGHEVEPERQEQGELIKEAWTEVVREAGHRYSVRYEEAFALECALQRRTTQRLEQRLAALERAA